jgi:DNA-binding NarL/FixJ family response regulator
MKSVSTGVTSVGDPRGRHRLLLESIPALTEQKALRRPPKAGTTRRRDDEQGHGLVALPVGPVLTHRELQVLEQVAFGLSNREIGARLGITEQTVKNHMWNLLRKLPAADRTGAAVHAVSRGWIRVPLGPEHGGRARPG